MTAMLFSVSIGAGIVGALMGLGGGVLIVPFLTMLGYQIGDAIPASIVAVIATSSGAAASYVKHGMANLRLAIFLAVATTTGAIAGAITNGLLSARALFLLFAGVLTYSGVMMVRKISPKGGSALPIDDPDRWNLGATFQDHLDGTVTYVPKRIGMGFFLMSVAGAVSGLLGIGSGALKVPAMDLAMDLPIKASTATSNFMIGLTGLASACVYLFQGRISTALAAPIALGVLVGSRLGTHLLHRMSSASVRRWFLVVLVVVVAQMVVKGVTS